MLEAKATEVVLEVTAMALYALLKLYAIRRCLLCFMTGMFSDCRQASQNTNMLSAAMPRMMKMTSLLS